MPLRMVGGLEHEGVECVRMAACAKTAICGVLPRHALLDVCIYACAPAWLTGHPHLTIFFKPPSGDTPVFDSPVEYSA